MLAKDQERSATAMVINDTQLLLAHYLKWSARHVRRDANKVAHSLAKSALLISDYIVNIEDSPPCITDLLVNE